MRSRVIHPKDSNSRMELVKSSQNLLSEVAIAYELLALLENPKNASHVAQIAYELSGILEDTKVPFFDINLMVGLDGTKDPAVQKMNQDSFQYIRKQLKSITSRENLNPPLLTADENILDENTLPIITLMMQSPEKSPELFIKLVKVLDNLIKKKELSIFAAGREISHVLDRPQIFKHPKLKNAVQYGYMLELPDAIRQTDALKTWNLFVHEVVSQDKI